MKTFALTVALCVALTSYNCLALAPSKHQPTRRAFVASTVFLPPAIASAFDGGGSSAYSGRTPLEKAAKAKGYKDRIVADVKDFNTLGAAITKGETEGDAWVGFFIQYQRREPDSVGRTYAALLDLIGVEKSGGSALLLATTFTKPNKPPQNTPQFKLAESLLVGFEPIKTAGQAGDIKKATKAYAKAAAALSQYLESVELPGDLSDPLYQ